MDKNQIKIMLVDDHQIIVDGISSLLSDVTNIAVVAQANNGKDAMAILEKTSVDIVLMDIEMPLLNGCDATTLITIRYPDIKVIALTSYDDKSIVKKMLNAGAKGYILKNISKEILLEAIDTVAKGKTYFSSEIPIMLATPSAEDIIAHEKHTSSISLLSYREIEVLKHVANGLSNNEIAKKLYISPKTVDTHRSNIMQKLHIHNVVGLVKYAIKSGLLE
ncbi:MAG: hypothetical protein A3F72_19420 [Bacteroidetes bacterium RIFCSPLOWO2_12_FULL_35_15]|nr:MAG: hypothetical protein A3F72_19420 [Bacteroidetes bacterium RIFCSPLOWO2_12_FULL_35_15]